MSDLTSNRRRLLGLVVLVVSAVAGVLIGRALGGDDSDTAEPPPATASSTSDADATILVADGSGGVVTLDRAALVDAGGQAGADDGVIDLADLRPGASPSIPVIAPAMTGGVGDEEVAAIADALLGQPIASGAVGADAGLRPILPVGATPPLGSIPLELGAADTPDPAPATTITVPVTLPPTPTTTAAEPTPSTAPGDTAPTADSTTTTEPPPTPPATPTTLATPSTGTVAAIDAPLEPALDVDLIGLGLIDRFRDLLIDPCAGVRPGDPVPEECPPGTGATLLGIGTPPEPFAFWGPTHYTEPAGTDLICPADTPAPTGDQAELTLFSWTPLDTASVRIRPYGTDLAWAEVTTVATSDDHRGTWNTAFAERELDASWAIVPHCLVVDRDPGVSYEVRAFATDLFGRDVESSTWVLGAGSPTLRPPTTGIVLPSGPAARITAWTHGGGVVGFSANIVDPDEPGDLTCRRTEMIEPAERGGSARPFPAAIYDPDFNRRVQADFPIPVAGALHVCAFIFETENTVRNPIAVDSMLYRAPAGERPRLVLQGIRRFGEETIERLTVGAGEYVDGGSTWDPCGQFVELLDIPPGDSISVESTLYDCGTETLLRADDDGRMTVPVVLNRFWSDPRGWESVELAVEIDVADCSSEPCGDRPREWYEIPIPTRTRVLCGRVFGSGGCDPEDSAAGIAVLRLDYDLVGEGGPSDGTAELIASTDITEPTRFDQLTVRNGRFDLRPATDPFVRDVLVSFDTDRPIRAGLRIQPIRVVSPSDCGATETPLTDDFRDLHAIEVTGLCAGYSYDFVVFGVGEDGTEWELDPRVMPAFSVPSVSNRLTAEVELLGGPARLGYLYRLGVQVERQDLTAYWLELDAPARGSNPSCVALDGTTARSRGFWPPTYFGPDELTVTVVAHVTTLGEDDCSGRPSGIEPIELTGTFTIEEFRGGDPLVVETPPDSPIQLRATIEQDGGWTAVR